MKEIHKIAVAGTGYVGLSLAVLLAQNHPVWCVNRHEEKAALINDRRSPIQDPEIEEYLASKDLDLTATTDAEKAYRNADLVIVATPTNYDPKQNGPGGIYPAGPQGTGNGETAV